MVCNFPISGNRQQDSPAPPSSPVVVSSSKGVRIPNDQFSSTPPLPPIGTGTLQGRVTSKGSKGRQSPRGRYLHFKTWDINNFLIRFKILLCQEKEYLQLETWLLHMLAKVYIIYETALAGKAPPAEILSLYLELSKENLREISAWSKKPTAVITKLYKKTLKYQFDH